MPRNRSLHSRILLVPQKWHRHSGFQTFFYGKMGEVIEKSKGVSNILQKSVLLQL